MFGSLENERKKREKREKPNPKMKATGFLLKCQNYFKSPLPFFFFFGYKMGGGGGGGGAYIGHQICETTIKPNILLLQGTRR